MTDDNTSCFRPKQKERNAGDKNNKSVQFFQIGCFILLLALVAIVAAEYIEIINLKQSRSNVDKEFNATLQNVIKKSSQQISMNSRANHTNIVNALEKINRTLFSYQNLINNLFCAYEEKVMMQLDVNYSTCAAASQHVIALRLLSSGF